METDQLLEEVKKKPLPQHVALIMDGNGRWAKAQGLPRSEGHRQGALSTERLVRFVAEKKLVSCLTLFAFSTENWARPRQEIEFLFTLLEDFLRKKLNELAEAGVRLWVLGDIGKLPTKLQRAIGEALRATEKNRELNLAVALNFGGRWAILEGVRRALALGMSPEEISPERFRKLLPTGELPEPDLIIRTGGHQRLSNFFLWEAAYAELYFTPTLWPDFGPQDFLLALKDFQGRSRNFGRVAG
ncbi:MAG TPA: di-trans,poly-cis-decaprenylcistransferase [Candidatus Acetothermia bacterium]|nr:di-trans,poly-cis-decaprenylcistransferase [Candidatus Acetothermia bacterium]